MVRINRILLIAISLISILNKCNAQITYKDLENLYGLGYFLFRNEQMIFNEEYITTNKIHTISVCIYYNEIELKSIYVYKKNGCLNKIKIPNTSKISKIQKFKTFKYNNNYRLSNNEKKTSNGVQTKIIEFLNTQINVTQIINNDTINKEILVMKSDSLIVNHYYSLGMPLKTEVNLLSDNSECFFFNKGINIIKYNYKNGLLVSITIENKNNYKIIYSYL